MAKTDKKPVIKIYTCSPAYLLESINDPNSLLATKKLVVDFSLSEEIAKKCRKLRLGYIGCSPSEKKCAALKKKLGFRDGYATGL